jgi:predicted anti-sigma-YlaC factor YlaD
MNCKQVGEHLLDIASGSPPAPGVEEHVNGCSACSAQLQELRSTMTLLDEWQAPEPSPYFNTRLRARLREEARAAPSGWLAWLRKPALAITMAMLMVGALLSFQAGRKDLNTSSAALNGDRVVAQPGTAVADLQTLDRNDELLANFELLDDIGPESDETP